LANRDLVLVTSYSITNGNPGWNMVDILNAFPR